MLRELGRSGATKIASSTTRRNGLRVRRRLTAEPCSRDADGHIYEGTPEDQHRGCGEGDSIMKRLSMIAAGLLALGLTAARAETAGKSNTTVEVVPPSAPNTDTNGNPKAPSDIDVNPNPNPTPP